MSRQCKISPKGVSELFLCIKSKFAMNKILSYNPNYEHNLSPNEKRR